MSKAPAISLRPWWEVRPIRAPNSAAANSVTSGVPGPPRIVARSRPGLPASFGSSRSTGCATAHS